MLYHAGRFMCAAFLLAGALTACSDDDTTPDGPVTPPDDATALATPVLASQNITQTGFKVTWTAIPDAAVYAYSIDAAEGDEPEYTLETSVAFSGLEAGSTHVVRVQAVPASTDTDFKASEFAEITVTTLAADPTFFTFELNWRQPTGAGVKCTPADDQTTYCFINATKDGLEFKEIDEYISDYMANNFWYGPGDWQPNGWDLFQGADEYTEYVNLEPATDYVLIAVAVDINGTILKHGTFEYSTTAIEKSDCTFAVEMGDISYNLVHYVVTPSDQNVLYTVDVCPVSEYEGMNDDEIVAAIMKKTYLQYYHGTQKDNNIPLTEQDTDYGIYIVGCVQQQPTTALSKTTFHSGKQDFDFAGEAYTEIELIYVAEVSADWATGLVKLAIQCTPNEATKVYRTICGPASAYEGMSDEEIGKLIEKEQDESQWHPSDIWSFDADRRVPLNGEGMVITLSRDASGKSGRLNKYKFTATPMGENPYPDDGDGPILGSK